LRRGEPLLPFVPADDRGRGGRPARRPALTPCCAVRPGSWPVGCPWSRSNPACSDYGVIAILRDRGARSCSRSRRTPISRITPGGSDGHVDEAGEVQLGGDHDRVGRAVAVLGDDDVRLAGARRLLVVVVVAVQQEDDVGILFDAPTFAKIG